MGRLQAEHPGLRPVLFHSPYEAAAWSIISARRTARQAAEVRRRLSEELGRSFELDGAMGPERAMADMRELRGIDPFYAGLIVVRATGLADVLLVNEP